MKKIFFLVTFGTSILLSCGSDKTEVDVRFKTEIEINSEYNAGKVIKGEIINANYEIENVGDEPLIISDVKGSCSCTIADYTDEPIPPGEKGYIKAKVKTENFPLGAALRSIRVLCNTTPAEHILMVKATIIK